MGTISCNPGSVTNPVTGGDHCVSTPISPQSFSAIEGDVGTLQHAINSLLDDNQKPFMTVSDNMPTKQTAVSVTRTAEIQTKEGCTLGGPGVKATCAGKYVISYRIRFDAPHSSGDTPPLTIVSSSVRVDTSSDPYTNKICPIGYFVDGCDNPVGSAADTITHHGSFYANSATHTAHESVKGSQPTGMVTLDYECESQVIKLPISKTMTVLSDGNGWKASFDDATFTDNMIVGQWLRFNAGDGNDIYRQISDFDLSDDTVTFVSVAPASSFGRSYSDVEFGTYHSDWSNTDSTVSGVSSICKAQRVHTTLPIDVTSHDISTLSKYA